MLYLPGTYIDLSHINKNKAPVARAKIKSAGEPNLFAENLNHGGKNTLYVPGTRIIFEQLQNFSGVIAKTIIPA